MTKQNRPRRLITAAATGLALALAVFTVAACGSSDEEDTDSGPATGQLSGGAMAAARSTTADPNVQPASPSPSPEPSPTEEAAVGTKEPRKAGEVQGVTFVVGEGSEATFTVTEQLAALPLPNDAVVRTTALSGEVRLDGRESVVQIDLQQLRSDNSRRDQYMRRRMFPTDPIAVFTVGDIGQLPKKFGEGEVITRRVQGELLIGGVTAPLTFEVEARDDGAVIFLVGRASFTWDDLEIPKPRAMIVVSLDDEVRVEVLLSLRPAVPSTG